MSLSSGRPVEDKIGQEDRDLIAAFLAKKSATVLPPVALTGSEMARHDRERLSKIRREFRDGCKKKQEEALRREKLDILSGKK